MATLIGRAKVFRNGGSQAIRLPKDMRVTGREVVVRQDFGIITILPKGRRKGSLLELLKQIGPIDLAPRDQPAWTDRRIDPALRVTSRRPRRAARR
jgi:antitoxin VapB